jgi:phospholipid/cholesterol/gamma-HCH transport system permease protein
VIEAFVGNALALVLLVCDLAWMIGRALRDAMAAVAHPRRSVIVVFFRQIYFSGLEPLRTVMTLALLIGTVVIAQIVSIAGGSSGFFTGKLITWIVVRELGPLLVAIVVIARSGTAIAAELSQMKIGGELDHLEALGIPVAGYLVMPRITGVAISLLLLTVYFEVAAVLGGFAVASLGWHVTYDLYAQGVFSVLTLGAVLGSLAKGVVFGLLIAAICCRQGLMVGQSVTQIPQAATRGVMQSLFVVLACDGLASLLYLV